MSRVLFVDDEARVLSGLRRQLFARRGEWDMAFVESGPAALEDLARTPADVLVSDMRMPGMDGAQLLVQVAQSHPRTARLVLSGQADPERLQVARACAHRFLSKPCPPETLQAEIARALAVRAALDGAHWPLAERLWCTPPAAVPEVARAFAALAEGTDAQTVAAEVERQFAADEPLRARVAALVPDAGAPRRSLLPVLLALRCFDTFLQDERPDAWRRAVALAVRAAAIAAAEHLPPETVAHAATAVALPGTSAGPDEARARLLEYLLPTWGFAEPVVAAAAHGHDPSACPPALAGPLALLCGSELLLGWSEPAFALPPERETRLVAWLKDRGWGAARERWAGLATLPA